MGTIRTGPGHYVKTADENVIRTSLIAATPAKGTPACQRRGGFHSYRLQGDGTTTPCATCGKAMRQVIK